MESERRVSSVKFIIHSKLCIGVKGPELRLYFITNYGERVFGVPSSVKLQFLERYSNRLQ